MGDLAIFGFGPGGWGLALLEGAAMTLLVSACGLLIGAAIGGLVAWARLSGKLLAGGVGAGLRGLVPRPAGTAHCLFRLFRLVRRF